MTDDQSGIPESGPSEESVAFTRSLVERFPSLVPIMEEHTYDGYGVVAGSFIADIGSYIKALFLIGRSETTELDDILPYLGDVLSLDRAELLEFLPDPGEAGEGIREMPGPAMLAQYNLIHGL